MIFIFDLSFIYGFSIDHSILYPSAVEIYLEEFLIVRDTIQKKWNVDDSLIRIPLGQAKYYFILNLMYIF